MNFNYESKKKIWNFLIEKKKERIIVMTTSDINEANILGDHILILNNGMVECLGSSNYIKNHYNINYYLEVEKGISDQTNDVITNYIPGSKVINDYQQKSAWELPLTSVNNFKELNRLESIYNEEKNYINHNLLYLPTVEEIYLNMDNKKSNDNELDDNDSYEIINDDDTNLFINVNKVKELPNIENVKKINKYNLFHLSIIYNYRIHNYLRYKNFVNYAILFPISVIGIIASMSIYSKFMVNHDKYSTFSSDLYYSNNTINLPINSNHQHSILAWNINPVNTTIPSITSSQFDKVLNTTNPYYSYKITSYNDVELNDIGKKTDNRKEMYFVSSISGNFDNDKYKMNIYYNESIVHALPASINLISNSILLHNNITQRIKTSITNQYNNTDSTGIDDNKDYIIFNVNSISIFFGITIFCLLSVFGNMIIRERLNKLIHHYQLAGYLRILFWGYTSLIDAIFFLSILICIIEFLMYKYQEIKINPILITHYI